MQLLSSANDQHEYNLIRAFNITIKSFDDGDKLSYYIWCPSEKLWKKNYRDNTILHNEISLILQRIASRALREHIIDKKQHDILVAKTRNGKWFNGLKRFFSIPADDNFDRELNIMHPYLPLKNGKKINMKTLEISERTIEDYWSFELKHTFIHNQPFKDNKFGKFLKQIFPDEPEYKHMVLLLGYMITALNDQNIFLMLQSKYGGSGKTTLMELFRAVFPDFCCKIQKDVLLHNKGNLGAEMCKLRRMRVAWMDEGMPQGISRRNIDVTNILKLTGGGSLGLRDCHQQGKAVKMYRITAKLVALGNSLGLSAGNHDALNRRVILGHVKAWFRAENGHKPNPNCPYLRPKDPNLKENLLKHTDHIFTFIILAANHYLNSNVNLVADQPEDWKRTWNNNDLDERKVSIIRSFIEEKCTKGNTDEYQISPPEFQRQLGKYAQDDHNYKKDIGSQFIETYITRNSQLDKISYDYHPSMIKGIRFNKNTSIFLQALNNEPQK